MKVREMKISIKSFVLVLVAVGASCWIIAKQHYTMSTTKIEVREKNITRTIIKRITDPSGRVEEVTTIDSQTDTNTSSKSTVASKADKTNISLLIKTNTSSFSSIQPIYGMYVSRPLIGSVTIGLFGFTDKTLGVSVGMNF